MSLPNADFFAVAEPALDELSKKPPSRVSTGVLGGRGMKWNGNVPTPVYNEPQEFTPDQAKAAQIKALNAPYRGTYDAKLDAYVVEKEFEGLTNYEVACIRRAEAAAMGNLKAVEQVEDRLFGKPKQAVESVQMKMSYQDFLESLAQESEDSAFDIYATPVEEYEETADDL